MTIGAPQFRDSNTETLGGGKTLVINDALNQFLDPGGSGRTVVLPALANGLEVRIINNQSAAEIITINDAAGNTVGSPTGLEAKTLYCDGTTWQGPETTLHS